MLNQDFCEFLEHEITKALSSSKDEQLRGFWCDGILLPHSEDEYSRKHVNDKQEVVLVAFAGKTGQDKYELTLRFGRKALSRYARGLSIEECVPEAGNADWLDINPADRKMVAQLD
ncbi:MAG: hypothetical protein INR73_00440 [Williamsia sp.]|nr:hypothetical protein [Williamsia sp.]